jgi:hypothetical protein
MTRRSDIDSARFTEIFLDAYLAGGLGSLPKREIDLLVLRALIEAGTTESPHTALAKADAFLLGREYRVRESRIRTMLDELRYRHPPSEAELKAQLRELLMATPPPDGGAVKIQIEDGLLRDYARKLVRNTFDIADTSFDRTVVALQPRTFLGLVLEVVGEKERAEFEEKLKTKTPRGVKPPPKDRVGWLLKQIPEGAAGEIGRQLLVAGQQWFQQKGPALAERLAELMWQVLPRG